MTSRKTKALRRKLREEAQEAHNPLFEIVVNMNDGQTAVAPIGWKISNQLVVELCKVNAVDPHVVICVFNGKGEIDRQLVPLAQLMTYITFRRAGTFKIRAVVVFREEYQSWDVKRFLKMDGCSERYETSVFSDDGKTSSLSHSILHQSASSCSVQVGTKLFAPEPPAWLAAWAYWLAPQKAKDECQFRRWVLFSAIIQPVLFILTFMIRAVVATWLAIYGMRDINYRAIFHMFRDDTDAVWSDVTSEDSIFINKPERRWEYKPFVWTFLTPAIWLFAIVAALALNFFFTIILFKPHPGGLEVFQVIGSTVLLTAWIILNFVTAGWRMSVAQVICLIFELTWFVAVHNRLFLIGQIHYLSPVILAITCVIGSAAIWMLCVIAVKLLGLFALPNFLNRDAASAIQSIRVFSKWKSWRYELRMEKKRKEEMEEAARNEEALLFLPQGRLVTNYYGLPRASRTFRLGWQTLKREVCRPFQR